MAALTVKAQDAHLLRSPSSFVGWGAHVFAYSIRNGTVRFKPATYPDETRAKSRGYRFTSLTQKNRGQV